MVSDDIDDIDDIDEDLFGQLAAGLTPVTPSGDLRADILGDARPEARFLDLSEQVATLMDVSTDRAISRLAGIDDEQSWEQGPFAGIDLYHLDGGPAVSDAIVGFVRIEPGAAFPEHEHLGTETVLVLQGAYRDSDGVVYRRGDQNIKAAGSSHDFEALEGPPLIYLVVAFEGVAIGEMILGPDDPRM
jgi:putative transcriptional regulator